jgi:hypothetical protein
MLYDICQKARGERDLIARLGNGRYTPRRPMEFSTFYQKRPRECDDKSSLIRGLKKSNASVKEKPEMIFRELREMRNNW